MSKYDFMQVDAFTTQPLSGNPCAVLFDTDDLDDATLLAIAKEMNLSETAFVRRSDKADFGVRYFTPAEEVPLAGHPTIATTFALAQRGQISLDKASTTITLELTAGVIEVEILCAPGGGVEKIIMSQKKPVFMDMVAPEDVLPVFDLEPADLLPGNPPQIVSTGTPQLMIPVTGLEVLKRIQINYPAYERLRSETGFFSPHLFCLQGVTEAGDTFARHFGVPPDTPEDPFTGSATGGMAAYLWHHGLIARPTFTAEQGHWMNRPGTAFVEVVGPPEDIQTVKVGGSAVSVLEGTFTLSR